jgi:RNA 3'-terminal phosphate cyclase (ATP)
VIQELDVEELEDSAYRVPSNGPGIAVMISLEYENVTEVFTGFGERGKHRESVAREAIIVANEYIGRGVPVGKHLADQLLVPLALSGGGRFVTCPPSLHTRINAEVIRMFTEAEIRFVQIENEMYEIIVEV